MSDLISREALCEYALNQKDKSITPNDIMRFPSAQPETHEKRTETHACDLIDRQVAIEAMEDVDWYHINKDGRLVHGANSDDHEPLYKAKDVYKVLNDVPSAQPEERTEERTETHACDCNCISRQAAIDAVYKCSDIFVGDMPVMVVKSDAYEALAQLPSAQPEVLACGEGELIAQPEIIRCNDCKHWTQTTGNMRPD